MIYHFVVFPVLVFLGIMAAFGTLMVAGAGAVAAGVQQSFANPDSVQMRVFRWAAVIAPILSWLRFSQFIAMCLAVYAVLLWGLTLIGRRRPARPARPARNPPPPR